MNNTYLAHYGVLGMKWGVRRYQNKDGTLTPAGQKKYEKREKTIKQIEKHANWEKENIRMGSIALSDINKALKSNNKKAIDDQFKKYFGAEDSMDELNTTLGTNYKNKKDALKDTASSITREINSSKKSLTEYKQRIDNIQNTPINKLTRDEKQSIAYGADKAAFLINTAGSVALGTAMIKRGNNIMSNKEIVKSMIALDLLFTAGAMYMNQSIVNASERSKK